MQLLGFFLKTSVVILAIYYKHRLFMSNYVKKACIMIRRKVTPLKNINFQSGKVAIKKTRFCT